MVRYVWLIFVWRRYLCGFRIEVKDDSNVDFGLIKVKDGSYVGYDVCDVDVVCYDLMIK